MPFHQRRVPRLPTTVVWPFFVVRNRLQHVRYGESGRNARVNPAPVTSTDPVAWPYSIVALCVRLREAKVSTGYGVLMPCFLLAHPRQRTGPRGYLAYLDNSAVRPSEAMFGLATLQVVRDPSSHDFAVDLEFVFVCVEWPSHLNATSELRLRSFSPSRVCTARAVPVKTPTRRLRCDRLPVHSASNPTACHSPRLNSISYGSGALRVPCSISSGTAVSLFALGCVSARMDEGRTAVGFRCGLSPAPSPGSGSYPV